ncbi:DUF2163 domain-containing protein [Rhizobium metallidurans]|uniref:Putative phage protein (TIGR02218 family) n=1 Tax=Rhizobium metallidurans TaxID=1265931 RepID=A0A7W6CSV2_9HYPH|nr:DUF2163 domain-containing protein [Rhizobium metallidurans]MBB3963739.1 putative phage protein (TIGR02218 family) [Rhizobium metallidurans]
MRHIPQALQAHLSGDATTVCRAWRVTRRDGVVLGFTEHDRDLTFSGTTFLAASGFSASAAEEEAGLPAATSDVAGGFSSAAITEDDLKRGRYDGARVEVLLVNWAEPDQHMLLKLQEIGDVTRDAGKFQAELRSFASRLDEPQGRVYGRRCDATLGDGRCGVDLLAPGMRAEGVVVSVPDASRLLLSGIRAVPDGFFRFGVLSFIDGGNHGQRLEIETHAVKDDLLEVTLWLPLEATPRAGDRVVLTAGCDKAFSTCRAKFANHLNFRGFPHIPGTDFAYTYADGESLHDGSALFK